MVSRPTANSRSFRRCDLETYSYDGTLEGFLTCLARLRDGDRILSYCGGRDPGLPVFDLFEVPVPVVTEPEKAEAFRTHTAAAYGKEALRLIDYGFRSGAEDREALLTAFIQALAEGRDPKDLSDNRLLRFRKSLSRISFEVHRMVGLLRFRELSDGSLHAEIEPDNDIVDLLIPHFRTRFPSERWVIRDLRREKAVSWDGSKALIFPYRDAAPMNADRNEEQVKDLWRLYFKTIEIQERRNPKLQARFVPRRYRKHLPEFEDED